MELGDIRTGIRIKGISADKFVTIEAIRPVSENSITIIYTDESGELGQKIVTSSDCLQFEEVTSEDGFSRLTKNSDSHLK